MPFSKLAQNAWREAGQRPDLFAQIDGMLERIRRERGSGSEILDFKTGLGGIIEAEFLVQALQMRAGTWNPQFHFAVEELRQAGVFAAADAAALQSELRFPAPLRIGLAALGKQIGRVAAGGGSGAGKTRAPHRARKISPLSASNIAARAKRIHPIYARYFQRA